MATLIAFHCLKLENYKNEVKQLIPDKSVLF